jgi:hypothetical protein
MATRTPVLQDALIDQKIYTWSGLLNGDDGAGASYQGAGDRTIAITGTFGAGGTVIVEGSLDNGINWLPLRDPSSTAISLTAAGVRAVLENVPLIRPRVTAGDGTTAITATMSIRRNGFGY